MDTLILGILEYSTIGKVKKEFYEVDLNVLIEDLILTLENPNDVRVSIPRRLPIIRGDQYRLELLFHHLIRNAIKFNNKGKDGLVEINCSDKNKYWQFSIKDNGKGIEEQYFDKIFIAFQKLENDYKSTGIGLSIVKKIIETYDGEIWLKSILNVETTFYFKIKK
jgi:signal transduction histidine kinase